MSALTPRPGLAGLAGMLLAMTLSLGSAASADETGATRSPGGALIKTLPNGLQLIVVENHAAPLAVVNTWFRVGARNEAPADEGISHFLEHMLFDGQEGYTLDDYNRFILTHAAYDNASTDQDNTNYHQTGPVRYLADLAHINRTLVSKPLLLDEHFGREREVVKEELRQSLDIPGYFLWDLVLPKALSHTGYDHAVIGSAETLDGQTNDQMRQYYRNYYGPNNAFTIAIGDFKAEDAMAVLEAAYGDWEPVTIAPDPELKPTTQDAPQSLVGHRDYATDYLTGLWPTVPARNNETYALQVLATILGSGDSSRLARRLMHDLGLVSSISMYTQELIDQSVIGFDAELVDPAKTTDAVNEILGVIWSLRDGGVTPEELERAKRQLALSKHFLPEDIQTQAYTLGYTINATGGLDYYETYGERIYGVTAADVQWAAQHYLDANSLTLGLATPDADKGAVEADWSRLGAELIVAAPQGLGRLGVNPFTAEPTVREMTPILDAPPANAGERLAGLERFTLPNGITVLVRRAPSQGTVGITLAARGGLGYESWETNGLGALTMDAILKGTTEHTSEELSGIIDSLGGSISASAGVDTLTLSGLVASVDLIEALDLFAELAQSATFPEEEVATSQEILLGEIAARADDSRSTTMDQLNYAQYGSESAYGRPPLGRPSVVAGLTAEDARGFYATSFRPDNLVLAVVGDLDVAAARSLVEVAFDYEPQTRTLAVVRPAPEYRAPVGFQRIINNADKAQTMSIIGLPGVTATDPDLPAISVVNMVLGGTWLGRLFDHLRGREGLAYGTYSSVSARPATGSITAWIGTRPEMWEAAIAGLRREFGTMAKDGITADEMRDAVNYVVGDADRSHAGMETQSALLASNVALGLEPDHEWRLIDAMQQVTLEQANAAAAKYFAVENAWLAVTGPIYGEGQSLE